MDVFSRAIFNSLALRQQVILPGVGTLRTEQAPDEPDQRDGRVVVPHTRVVFVAGKEPGETLPEVIAGLSEIPLKDIKPQYYRWVSGLKKNAPEGHWIIEGVVSLAVQPDGSFAVKVSKALEDLLNPIGQKHMDLPVLLPATESEHAKKTPEKKRRRKGWIVVLLVLILLGGAGYYACMRGRLEKFCPVSNTSISPGQPTVRPEQPVVEAPAPLPDTLPADSVRVESPPQVPDSVPDEPSGDIYHVVAGVFSTRQNAERCIRENGFAEGHATIVLTQNGKFMVSVGQYTDKSEADREVARLQTAIPQAWVSTRRR